MVIIDVGIFSCLWIKIFSRTVSIFSRSVSIRISARLVLPQSVFVPSLGEYLFRTSKSICCLFWWAFICLPTPLSSWVLDLHIGDWVFRQISIPIVASTNDWPCLARQSHCHHTLLIIIRIKSHCLVVRWLVASLKKGREFNGCLDHEMFFENMTKVGRLVGMALWVFWVGWSEGEEQGVVGG